MVSILCASILITIFWLFCLSVPDYSTSPVKIDRIPGARSANGRLTPPQSSTPPPVACLTGPPAPPAAPAPSVPPSSRRLAPSSSDTEHYRDPELSAPLLGSSEGWSDDDSERGSGDEREGSGVGRGLEGGMFLKGVKYDESNERLSHIALQVFFPYIIAGLGMVAAGYVLDVVKVCSRSL